MYSIIAAGPISHSSATSVPYRIVIRLQIQSKGNYTPYVVHCELLDKNEKHTGFCASDYCKDLESAYTKWVYRMNSQLNVFPLEARV